MGRIIAPSVNMRTIVSIKYIRENYTVPAKLGAKIRFTPHGDKSKMREGIIVGSKDSYLKVKFGEEKQIAILHPTWSIEYITGNVNKN